VTEPRDSTFGGMELLAKLSAGGMGEVLLARRRGAHGFEKLIAVKTIKYELARREDMRKMFLDEARLMARLDHPAIAQVYDFGEENGTLYLAMEYVPGLALNRLLKRRPGPVPARVAARLISEVCRGLHAAHELVALDGTPLGVVHRDVSPQNVMLTFDGRVKILDFGIATRRDREAPETGIGVMKGKISYAAPEQIIGGRVDRRTDVYGAAVVLYELLAGKRPFHPTVSEAADLEERRNVPKASTINPSIPPAVEAALMRGLAYKADDRFPDAKEMAAALEDAAAGAGGETLEEFAERELAEDRKMHRERLHQIARSTGEASDPDGGTPSGVSPAPPAPGSTPPIPAAGGGVPGERAEPTGGVGAGPVLKDKASATNAGIELERPIPALARGPLKGTGPGLGASSKERGPSGIGPLPRPSSGAKLDAVVLGVSYPDGGPLGVPSALGPNVVPGFPPPPPLGQSPLAAFEAKPSATPSKADVLAPTVPQMGVVPHGGADPLGAPFPAPPGGFAPTERQRPGSLGPRPPPPPPPSVPAAVSSQGSAASDSTSALFEAWAEPPSGGTDSAPEAGAPASKGAEVHEPAPSFPSMPAIARRSRKGRFLALLLGLAAIIAAPKVIQELGPSEPTAPASRPVAGAPIPAAEEPDRPSDQPSRAVAAEETPPIPPLHPEEEVAAGSEAARTPPGEAERSGEALESATEEDEDVRDDEAARSDVIELDLPGDAESDPLDQGQGEEEAALAANEAAAGEKPGAPEAREDRIQETADQSGRPRTASAQSPLKTHGDGVPAKEVAAPDGSAQKSPVEKKGGQPAAREDARTHGESVRASDLAAGRAHPGTQPRSSDKSSGTKGPHAPERAPSRTGMRVPEGWPGAIRPPDRSREASHGKSSKAPTARLPAKAPSSAHSPHEQAAKGHKPAAHASSLHGSSSHGTKHRPTTYGLLAIDADPNAVVVIDGRTVGLTPLPRLKVPVGRHDVQLRRPYTRALRWRKTVTIFEGKKHRIMLQ
jgi:eukaryotic-like serine/threonine-protein kinase